ncbi:hypothetical protein LD39_20920 [Halobacillus sp. BBL2006]|nr:hypothetical protein LD39_20920 [Halobacillus sp. BBL2006]
MSLPGSLFYLKWSALLKVQPPNNGVFVLLKKRKEGRENARLLWDTKGQVRPRRTKSEEAQRPPAESE